MPLWFVISFYARYVIFASDLLYHKSRWYLERGPPFLILPFNHQWGSVALNEDQFLQEGLKMSNSKMILKIYFPNNFCNFASEQKNTKNNNCTYLWVSIRQWPSSQYEWLPMNLGCQPTNRIINVYGFLVVIMLLMYSVLIVCILLGMKLLLLLLLPLRSRHSWTLLKTEQRPECPDRSPSTRNWVLDLLDRPKSRHQIYLKQDLVERLFG